MRLIYEQVLYLYEDFIDEITVDYQNDSCHHNCMSWHICGNLSWALLPFSPVWWW